MHCLCNYRHNPWGYIIPFLFAAKAILFEVNVVALFVFSLSNLTWGGPGGANFEEIWR